MRIYVAWLLCLLSIIPADRVLAEEASRTKSARPLSPPLLVQQLAVSRTDIAFSLAGDIWLVPRSGGPARQLTHGPAIDGDPYFSPDGRRIAFSRTAGSNSDVYVMSIGEEPVRLTFHPGNDLARGWTPDGSKVLFASVRGFPSTDSAGRRLYVVPVSGGAAEELPIPIARAGVFTPDGMGMVYAEREVGGSGYNVGGSAYNYWRNYRGGMTSLLDYTNLRGGSFRRISDGSVNDRSIVLAGQSFVMASDRDGGVHNLFTLDPASGQVHQLTRFRDTGLGAVAGAPDGVVAYEREGRIYTLDLASGAAREVRFTAAPDRSEMALRKIPAAKWISDAAVGRGGAALAFVARGDILLFDRSSKAFRNVTSSSGAFDHSPAFSLDGQTLAYVSDASGEDDLYIRRLGSESVRRISLPRGRGGYQELSWSPDGRKIALTDKRFAFWLADLATGKVIRADSSRHATQAGFATSWSPDSRWIAYAKYLPNNNRALFLYDVEKRQPRQITDGAINADQPVFDADGRYLYFIASGNSAVADAIGMEAAIMRPLVLREIRAIALRKEDPSPLAADRETVRPEPGPMRIDFDDIDRRVWTAPGGRRDYDLIIPTPQALLATALEWPTTPAEGDPTIALFQLTPGADEPLRKIVGEIGDYYPATDGSVLFPFTDDTWKIRSGAVESSIETVDLSNATVMVDPVKEWHSIYRQAWRAFRDRFYDPHFHGQNLAALEARHAKFLPGVTRRADLTTLLYKGLGNLSVSHISLSGGDFPSAKSDAPAGTLGVNFAVANGRYRFARIYRPQPDPRSDSTRSPFEGVRIEEGEYLFAIDGENVSPARDVYSYLVGKGGKKVSLLVGKDPSGRGARTLTVKALSNDGPIRQAAWIENNRRRVEQRSNGTLGYVYIPVFSREGTETFLQQWIAAGAKDGVLIDQRYNPGGQIGDYILDFVSRRPLAYYAFRDANDITVPMISVRGPRVLLINEYNGSASSTFPWLFRRARQGLLVGTRTSGWGIGSLYGISFQDGGSIVVPMRAFFNPEGRWEVETEGVAPDVTVEQDPKALLAGTDTQLERAIDILLEQRRRNPTPIPQHPKPIDVRSDRANGSN